jgi:translation initiation factor 3 subunit H
MLRQLKEVHADDNVVGFYQSSSMDAFFTKSLVATQASDQDKLRHGGVVLVHGMDVPCPNAKTEKLTHKADVAQTARGNAGLRAFRLSSAFMSAHGKRKFNTQRC